MPKKTTPQFVKGLSVKPTKDITDKMDSVLMSVDTSDVDDFDEIEQAIQDGQDHLQAMHNTIAKENALRARALFDEHDALNTVETEFSIGGVEMNVTTHRKYSEEGAKKSTSSPNLKLSLTLGMTSLTCWVSLTLTTKTPA